VEFVGRLSGLKVGQLFLLSFSLMLGSPKINFKHLQLDFLFEAAILRTFKTNKLKECNFCEKNRLCYDKKS
jgi:hypothetical protein